MIKILGKLILTMFNIGRLGNFPGTIASAVTSFIYIIFFYFKVHYLTLFLIFLLLLLSSVYLINVLKNVTKSISLGDIIETNIYTDQNWYLHDIHGFTSFIAS